MAITFDEVSDVSEEVPNTRSPSLGSGNPPNLPRKAVLALVTSCKPAT